MSSKISFKESNKGVYGLGILQNHPHIDIQAAEEECFYMHWWECRGTGMQLGQGQANLKPQQYFRLSIQERSDDNARPFEKNP